MAGKKKVADEAPKELSGDKVTPDKPARSRKNPPKEPVVKVTGGRVVKKAPPKAAQKAPKRPNKPAPAVAKALAKGAEVAEKKPRRRTGTTKIKPTVQLTPTELEALQAGNLHGLDERQAKFIDLWLVTQNATQAYLDAGFECSNPNSAAAAASRLLRKVKEHPYTQAKRVELFAKTEEIQNRVIERVYGAALADPRELAEVIYTCCRYCWGEGFKYQMTPRQMEQRKQRHQEEVALAKAEKRKVPVFDPLGGLGYDQTRDPHPECPECNGVGERTMKINDTRYLSPGALGLFGGVKINKDGSIEVKVGDQLPYLTLLGRIFNMNIEPVVPVAAVVSQEELDERYARALQKTQAQREAMADRAAQIAALDNGGEV
ncbi:terminase small subunit [Pseudomonas monteilii]|uniref:terminase small subunit n=1 Tax=Pseudomonas monteilii TaxID=76759 RepID=UPI003F6DC9DB